MIVYCGICYHDLGRYVLLNGPYYDRRGELLFTCPFCQVERHPKGVKSRESLHPFKEVAAPMTIQIAHVVSGPRSISA